MKIRAAYIRRLTMFTPSVISSVSLSSYKPFIKKENSGRLKSHPVYFIFMLNELNSLTSTQESIRQKISDWIMISEINVIHNIYEIHVNFLSVCCIKASQIKNVIFWWLVFSKTSKKFGYVISFSSIKQSTYEYLRRSLLITLIKRDTLVLDVELNLNHLIV